MARYLKMGEKLVVASVLMLLVVGMLMLSGCPKENGGGGAGGDGKTTGTLEIPPVMVGETFFDPAIQWYRYSETGEEVPRGE